MYSILIQTLYKRIALSRVIVLSVVLWYAIYPIRSSSIHSPIPIYRSFMITAILASIAFVFIIAKIVKSIVNIVGLILSALIRLTILALIVTCIVTFLF